MHGRQPHLPFSTALLAAAVLTFLGEAPPPAPPAASKLAAKAIGEITGTIKTTAKILRLVAVDRDLADVPLVSELQPTPAAADPKPAKKDSFIYEGRLQPDGTFSVAGLIPGRSYDLIVWTQSTPPATSLIRWEGASLDFHRDVVPSTPATDDDRKGVEELVTGPATFFDKARVLRIAADHQHATALVELIRTQDFDSNLGGEVIYRVELWYFENLFGGWAKDKNTEKPIERIRAKPDAIPENWQFLPELGGIVAGGEKLSLTLPEKPDPRHGLVGKITPAK